jgi:hypothetical protein
METNAMHLKPSEWISVIVVSGLCLTIGVFSGIGYEKMTAKPYYFMPAKLQPIAYELYEKQNNPSRAYALMELGSQVHKWIANPNDKSAEPSAVNQ